MITMGVDAHKRVHVAVAVDAAGGAVARWRGPKSVPGWQGLAAWAATLGPDCRWGIAGAWNDGRGLAQQLVAAGAAVEEVHPRWTAAGRRRARRSDKNERLDARASALYLQREAATRTAIVAEDDTTVLALLVTERDDLVTATTRLRNQLHQLLRHLDPEDATPLPRPRTPGGVRDRERSTSARPCPRQQQRAAGIRRVAPR